jgi:TPP-dependent pyruvate/acetoin dehydrogenase alpha subunit
MDEPVIRTLDAEVMAEIADAYEFADKAPDPEPGELFTDVYRENDGER